MPLFSLMPTNRVVVAKGVQNVKITKNYILDKLKWNKIGNRYIYKISDEITDGSIVLINSLPEYADAIASFGVGLSCPELSVNQFSIYATTEPDVNIVIDYVICKEIDAPGTDGASDVPYTDSFGIGATNVQEALDRIVSLLNSK